MDNSDDYFTDDFILNDDALAILDEEEQKHTLSTQKPSKSHSPPAPPAPPPKRQKTETGWIPAPVIRRTETLDDMDDLPEITVQGDGTYGLHARHAAIESKRTNATSSNYLANNTPLVQSNRSMHRQHMVRTTSSSSLPNQQPRNPSTNPTNRPQPLQVPAVTSRDISAHSLNQNTVPERIPSQLSSSTREESNMGEQIEALQRQMEELRKDNERIQSDLKDAVNVRLAKEGEVSILRKSIEKTAQDHSTQMAKLKSAKEEADAKQVQMQKEIREEMERLRTQYTFKQHEMETSTRKPQWSVSSKRIATEVPPTPIDVPSQMRSWNPQSDMRSAGPSNHLHETPRGPRFGTLSKESPRTIRNRKIVPALESAKKSTKLPGFYNSFATSTPVRPSQTRQTKAKKGDQNVDDSKRAEWVSQRDTPSIFGQPPGHFSGGPPPPSPPSSPTRRGRNIRDVDMQPDDPPNFATDDGQIGFYHPDMGSGDMMEDKADGFTSEELDDIVEPNWREELHRMLLTHTMPSCASGTFQTLMKAPSDTSMPPVAAEAYTRACSQILKVLAATSNSMDWENALYSVSISLVDMVHLLNNAKSIMPLTALLSLLTSLSYSLPTFSSFLLTPNDQEGHTPAVILVMICSIIRDHLSPSSATIKDNAADSVHALATSTISLVESLCWNISDDMESQLSVIPRSPQVLSVLLDAAQPLWLLSKSARMLMLLSSRSNLFRCLVSFPDSGVPREATSTEHTKIPHIERLCSILVDSNLQGVESQSLRSYILAFFTMLAVAHQDALTFLLESLTLIPSLVLHLTHLTTPFREENLELMASPSAIAYSIQGISRTLVLLNYLMFNSEHTSNLRQKLHHAPHRQFNGITHMFIVTFGTLSYVDPPDWVDHESKLQLEQISEMARDLLDLVVEGPEGDSVYAAYQIEPDEGSITDDEEMEARLLDANEV